MSLKKLIISIVDNKRAVLICGNGGSASQADHFAGELVKDFEVEGSGMCVPAISLNNIASVTAIGNDLGYDEIFAQQIKAFKDISKVVIFLSTSGTSKSIIKGMIEAMSHNLDIFLITGINSKIDEYIPEDLFTCIKIGLDTADIQEKTLKFIHDVCRGVELDIRRKA